ncbi:MAG: hypothetical protein RLW62_21720 [Gammaproteobacteria bacterium]
MTPRSGVVPDAGQPAGVRASSARRNAVRRTVSRRSHLLVLIFALAATCADVMAVECRPQGTRFERNYCASLEAHAAELALNEVTTRARAAFATDIHALAAFERANRAWADYVAATLATAFPCAHDDLALCYGDGTPLCVARLRARLADERRALLDELLARPPGPDDCE